MLIYICISYLGVSNSLRRHGLWPNRLLCPWNSLGKNSRVGRHSLLQGIFPTQGSNLDCMHYRQNFNRLSHQRSPMNLYIYPYMLYIIYRCIYINCFPRGTMVKNLTVNTGDAREVGLISRKILWSRKWQPTPVLLPGKLHGQKNLVGYSPWGCRVRHYWACMHVRGHTHTHTHTHTRCCTSFSCLQER